MITNRDLWKMIVYWYCHIFETPFLFIVFALFVLCVKTFDHFSGCSRIFRLIPGTAAMRAPAADFALGFNHADMSHDPL
jgi:hypothetical protein